MQLPHDHHRKDMPQHIIGRFSARIGILHFFLFARNRALAISIPRLLFLLDFISVLLSAEAQMIFFIYRHHCRDFKSAFSACYSPFSITLFGGISWRRGAPR